MLLLLVMLLSRGSGSDSSGLWIEGGVMFVVIVGIGIVLLKIGVVLVDEAVSGIDPTDRPTARCAGWLGDFTWSATTDWLNDAFHCGPGDQKNAACWLTVGSQIGDVDGKMDKFQLAAAAVNTYGWPMRG